MKLARRLLLAVVIIFVAVVALVGIFWEQLPIRLVLPYLVQSPISIEGEVQTMQIDGESGAQTFFLYLPAGYETSTESYPVIYHLHGAFLQKSWAEYECNNLGSHMENAVAAGISEPMIIVCAFDPEGDSMWSDSYDGQYMAWTGLTQDSIPYIDANYRTLPERSGRIIQGFSMGGFGAIMNAYRSPDLFGTLVILDGAIHNWETLTTTREGIATKMFSTEDYFNQWSPWTLTTNASEIDMNIYFLVGEMNATSDFASRFRPHLESQNIAFTSIDANCPHSVFCIMDNHGEEIFGFIVDSIARQETNSQS